MSDLALFGDEMVTTKELAEQMNTSPKVILENARKCLPNKRIENGKPTYWTKGEIDILVEQLKCNQPNGRTFPNLSVELKGLERCERDSSITTMQFAKQLGTNPNVVLENARKCLPAKHIENGKPTFWTKEEITVVLDYMKSHTSNNRSVEFNSTVASTSTDLTPALKIKKAMELMQEGYEEEIAILKAKNAEKQAVIDRIEKAGGCFSIAQTAKALKLPYGRNTLFNRLKAMKFLSKSNEPYQAFVSPGYFKVISKVCSDNQNHIVPLVTGKGLVYLAKKFNTEIDPAVMPDME